METRATISRPNGSRGGPGFVKEVSGRTRALSLADESIGVLASRPGGATTVFAKSIGKAFLWYRQRQGQGDETFFLVMPKEPVIGLTEAEGSGKSLLGHVMIVGEKFVAHLGLTNGFRMVVDEGPEGGQSVYRIHLLILSGHQFDWPAG
ncbi:HINT1 protein, partial [Alaudala cheleensis]|nr:HINT1 protein [Alaudala cheleensis]